MIEGPRRIAASLATLLAILTVLGAPPAATGAAPSRATDECFVAETYRTFLDRDPTDGEVGSWVDRFDGGLVRSQLPGELARSDAWLRGEVTKLYRAALDRDPDPEGRDHWVERLRQGASVNRIGTMVYASAEVYDRAGGTPEGFVDDVYRRILGRSPDPAGHAYWLGQVDRLGRGRVAGSFFASVESRTGRVRTLFADLLGRAPDAAGEAYWASRLATINDVWLAVHLAASSERYQRTTIGCEESLVRVTSHAGHAGWPTLSADGRHLAYTVTRSGQPAWLSDKDIYIQDRVVGSTTRITAGTGSSTAPTISADGRHVAFTSSASDLVPGDTNGRADIFTWDRTTGTTTRVTDGDRVPLEPSISANGRFVAFSAFTPTPLDAEEGTRSTANVYVWDRETGSTTTVTQGNGSSYEPTISADGRHIAFTSDATDLLPGDTNGRADIHTWDRTTGTTTRVTHGNSTSDDPSISADGLHIAFTTVASDLVPGDTNGHSDIYTWDRTTGTTTRTTAGNAPSVEPSISADGRRVSFTMRTLSYPSPAHVERWDVFVVDRTTSATVQVTRGNGSSWTSAISPSGGQVAFASEASNLLPDDTEGYSDVFVWDRGGWRP